MKLLATLFLGFISAFYSAEDSVLNRIQEKGEIHVVTRRSPTTFYEDDDEKAGLEYELAQHFADELGVKLKISVVNEPDSVFSTVINQNVDFAAAGLPISNKYQNSLRFSSSYQITTQQVVYHTAGKKPPENIVEFKENHILSVVAGSHHVEYLKQSKEKNTRLIWREISNITPADLLEEVFEQKFNYAIVDSNEVAQMRQFYPELEVAFELPERQVLAWAFPRTKDESLYISAIEFLNRIKKSGKLSRLIEHYYGHIDAENFNHFDVRTFHKHIETRLPKYKAYFQEAAEKYGLDWRFLAAMSYQESKWNPEAVSFTGVRGLMMLTELAATDMGIIDRKDPIQSIDGGTRYFLAIKERIPKEVQELDRTWLALAAYNVGFGHLTDARKLTRQLGGNPNHWVDLKKTLPLLTQHYWYRQTQHGQARGYEPVYFVKNIRRFYDILIHLDERKEENEGIKFINRDNDMNILETFNEESTSLDSFPLPLKILPSQQIRLPSKEPPLNTAPPPSIPVL
jgi:membrane-bound lytic murein transglycosylase F